ncbi:unannotated protein [freshwater metagenome]|uniref:Unannotated protein n=1 Tax=freshwater metagenome TaxID=449393 RepID=A0A6J6ZQY6_9ZZZZ
MKAGSELKKSDERLGNLQLLRFFAALLVIIFHTVGNAHKNGISTPRLDMIGDIGRSGVDIFFVISGFVMVQSQAIRVSSPIFFISRRIIRIFPLYCFLTIIYYILASVFPSQFPNLELSIKWLIASLTFSSGILGLGEPLIWLGWTLEFEFLFYLVFSLALFSRSTIRTGLLTVISFIAIVPIFGLNPIVFEFCFGIVAAIIFQRISINAFFCKIISIFGAMALIGSVTLESNSWNRPLIWGIPSFLLVLSSSQLKQTKNAVILKLGNSSFSAYLIQIFTIPILFKVDKRLNFHFFQGDALVVVMAIITILSGLLMYEVAEKRVTKYLNRRILSFS